MKVYERYPEHDKALIQSGLLHAGDLGETRRTKKEEWKNWKEIFGESIMCTF